VGFFDASNARKVFQHDVIQSTDRWATTIARFQKWPTPLIPVNPKKFSLDLLPAKVGCDTSHRWKSDIEVPFDIRFAGGKDIQLERAKDEMVRPIEAKKKRVQSVDSEQEIRKIATLRSP